MKILAWIFGITLTLLAIAYILAFTPPGNSIVKPILESKIKEQTKLDSKLDIFSLSMSDFEILLTLNNYNTIFLKGEYSLFSQTVDIVYNIKLEELNSLQSLTQTQLNSSFHTNGRVKGDMAFIELNGESDVASSVTSYHVELTELNPTSIIAKIDNADLKSLLYMVNQKEYASAKINLDIDFKNVTPHKLDGDILLVTRDAHLNATVLKKDFNVSVPRNTAFEMNLKAILAGDYVDYQYMLKSNLAKVSSSGNIVPKPLALDIKYGVDIKELALLKPISGADVRGSLKLSGKVKGSKEKLVVDGKTDFAYSNSTFKAVLANFAPKSVKANVKGLKLQRALYMVKQPHYADGDFDLMVDISDARVDSLQGTIKSKITKGLVDSKYMTKTYEFNAAMPRTTFNATTFSTLSKNIVDTKMDFNSNLADFDVKSAKFNMSDASIISDYVVKAHNLDKFFFATDRHLKGTITANGELKKGKDLDFTMHSDLADGSLDAKLRNDDLHADVNSLQTLTILDMLIYPKIFKSSIIGALDYNLAEAKGVFNADLVNGTFTKNQVLDLAKQYADTDMYKDVFKGKVNAKINKENILASLDLKSNRSSIKTKNTKLNSLTKNIKSKIDVNANGNPFIVYLSGNTDAPKIEVDANKLIQREATKALESEAKKFLQKKDTKGLEKEAQKFLKGFF